MHIAQTSQPFEQTLTAKQGQWAPLRIGGDQVFYR
jgi:hypothetical protein